MHFTRFQVEVEMVEQEFDAAAFFLQTFSDLEKATTPDQPAKRPIASISVAEPVELPVELDITFTKQVAKKNKVFSEGRMYISASLYVKVVDEFFNFVCSIDLRGNLVKQSVFAQQYLRAVNDSSGLIQSVFNGVMVHIDSPPIIREFENTLSRASPPLRDTEVPLQVFTVSLHAKVTESCLPKIPNEFVKASDFVSSNTTPPTSKLFSPVTALNQLYSLYSTAATGASHPQDPVTMFCLRIMNILFKEVYELMTGKERSRDKRVVVLPGRWRLVRSGQKLFLTLPPSCDPPKEFFEVFSVTVDNTECWLRPLWRGFDPKGRIAVEPFSHESISLTRSDCVSTVTRGGIGLHCNLQLVDSIKKLVTAESVFPKSSGRWTDNLGVCLKSVFCYVVADSPLLHALTLPDSIAVPSVIEAVLTTAGSLTEDQQNVLKYVTSWFTSNDVKPCICLHGVFGCGKSTVLASVIAVLNAILSNAKIPPSESRILILAATNVAVDTVLKKLGSTFGISDFARVGIADRVDASLSRQTQRSSKPGGKRIVAATTAAAVEFDFSCPFVIVDEAVQATEVNALLPLLKTRPVRMLFCGDTRQLRQCGTETICGSLMESLGDAKNVHHMQLSTQFRCHPDVAKICSELFYESRVVDGCLLGERLGVAGLPVVGICSHYHEASRGSLASQQNVGECDRILHFLLENQERLRGKTIAVITFFNAQVKLLQGELCGRLPHVKVHTVDSCQGSEADVVILSVVASDPKRSEAFIANPNRLNVALSRARSHLFVFAHKSVWDRVGLFTGISKYGVPLC